MKILITGGSSLLGKSLIETAPENVSIQATWHQNYVGWQKGWTADRLYRCNITEKSDVELVFSRVQPNVVIHCAAHGSVDYAENNYQEVHNVNVGGTKHVINAANDYSAKIVYISTNAVYDGNNPPYDENSPLEPVNAYGVIKRQAEELIRDTAEKWLIVRPFLLYGWPFSGGRTNWASAIYEKLNNGGSFKLVADHTWMPTYGRECASAIWKLLFQSDNEIYNVAAPERATLYEFGLKICDVFSFDRNLIRPVQSEFFMNMAKRPRDTSYDLIKLSKADIMLSDIRTGLEKMKSEL
jgi:dTDP-4-dehydrorhamnose reductase